MVVQCGIHEMIGSRSGARDLSLVLISHDFQMSIVAAASQRLQGVDIEVPELRRDRIVCHSVSQASFVIRLGLPSVILTTLHRGQTSFLGF